MSAVTSPNPKTTPSSAIQQAKALLNPLNLHWAGVALLALVNLYLVAHMIFLWRSASNYNADAMDQQRITLHAAEIAALPLRGLDAKLARSTNEADEFSHQRLPASDSDVAAEIGTLVKKQGVRLTRASYQPAPVLVGSSGELTEVRIDTTLTGDYRPLVQLINSFERDKMFFVILGETLTGQQSGTVSLRLRLKTYERRSVMLATPASARLPLGEGQSATSGNATAGGAR
ncbi:MAG: hypothetical protein P4K80_02660 [Acidobacteriaceae bacterium]|nr:hypothetical protein [Acidobacteriaceae bacterium]